MTLSDLASIGTPSPRDKGILHHMVMIASGAKRTYVKSSSIALPDRVGIIAIHFGIAGLVSRIGVLNDIIG